MKVLLLDNYDSFTYNLLHLMEQFEGVETVVLRNDEITVDQAAVYDRILISPGPGLPSEAGITKKLIAEYYNSKPIFGICLGLQAIGEVCGGNIYNMPEVMHGVSTKTIIIDPGEELFKGISSPFLTGRYHSWALKKETLPVNLHVTAIDDEGVIMAARHDNNLLRGVQFHPESILTDFGRQIVENWLFHC